MGVGVVLRGVRKQSPGVWRLSCSRAGSQGWGKGLSTRTHHNFNSGTTWKARLLNWLAWEGALRVLLLFCEGYRILQSHGIHLGQITVLEDCHPCFIGHETVLHTVLR